MVSQKFIVLFPQLFSFLLFGSRASSVCERERANLVHWQHMRKLFRRTPAVGWYVTPIVRDFINDTTIDFYPSHPASSDFPRKHPLPYLFLIHTRFAQHTSRPSSFWHRAIKYESDDGVRRMKNLKSSFLERCFFSVLNRLHGRRASWSLNIPSGERLTYEIFILGDPYFYVIVIRLSVNILNFMISL